MSAFDALQLIDSKLESLREGPMVLIGNEAAIGILTIIRNGLVADPEWSEVTEANLRANVLRIARERDIALDALERARSLAVRLEQENAALTVGAARRVL